MFSTEGYTTGLQDYIIIFLIIQDFLTGERRLTGDNILLLKAIPRYSFDTGHWRKSCLLEDERKDTTISNPTFSF